MLRVHAAREVGTGLAMCGYYLPSFDRNRITVNWGKVTCKRCLMDGPKGK